MVESRPRRPDEAAAECSEAAVPLRGPCEAYSEAGHAPCEKPTTTTCSGGGRRPGGFEPPSRRRRVPTRGAARSPRRARRPARGTRLRRWPGGRRRLARRRRVSTRARTSPLCSLRGRGRTDPRPAPTPGPHRRSAAGRPRAGPPRASRSSGLPSVGRPWPRRPRVGSAPGLSVVTARASVGGRRVGESGRVYHLWVGPPRGRPVVTRWTGPGVYTPPGRHGTRRPRRAVSQRGRPAPRAPPRTGPRRGGRPAHRRRRRLPPR